MTDPVRPVAPREDELRYCNCADPENCRETVPGYVCRKGAAAPVPCAASPADPDAIEELLRAFDSLYKYANDDGAYSRPNRARLVLETWWRGVRHEMPTSETRPSSGPTRGSTVGIVADTGLHDLRRKANGRPSVESVARETEPPVTLQELVAALRERTWLSPVSAEEMNHRDRWLATQIENAGGWQPIATAPRGKRVLALMKAEPLASEGEITWAYWTTPEQEPLALEGMWTHDETGELCEPTHWMSLPSPPRATGEGARECSNDLSAAGSDTGPSGTTTARDTADAAVNREVAQRPTIPVGTASINAPVAIALDPHRLPSEEIERAAWCGNSVYHDDWEQGRYDDRCGACRRSRNAIELLLARLRGEATVRVEE